MLRLILSIHICLVMGISPAFAESWDEFRALKSRDEAEEVLYKGRPSIVPKETIVRTLKETPTSGSGPYVVFSSDLILFEPGSWRIKEHSARQLKEIAEGIKDPRLAHIPFFVVEGHTCNLGSEENNLRLSQKRVESVVSHLTQVERIDAGRLQPRAFGKCCPIASNETSAGRRINRRVVLKAVDRVQQPSPQATQHKPPPEALSTATSGKALLVAIEEYRNPRHNLVAAREDVGLLARELVERKVFAKDQIRILLDKEASKESIVSHFKEWLINGTRPGDTALFYFSGHGIQIWDEDGDERDDGMDEALVCWDTELSKPKVTRTFNGNKGSAFDGNDVRNALIDDEIKALVKQLQGRTVVFFSDACHSGTVYKRVDPFFAMNKTIDPPVHYKSVFDDRISSTAPRHARSVKNDLAKQLVVPGIQLAAFTASADEQVALIAMFDREPQGHHSVFTWHLVQGLSGQADLDGNGIISFEELASFLKVEVRKSGFAQIPQHEFSPRDLGLRYLVSGLATQQAQGEIRSRIAYTIKEGPGISTSEVQSVRSALSRAPFLEWSEGAQGTSCLVRLEKRGPLYGVRLSDSTGFQWETHQGPDLKAILTRLMGNLKAYYIQDRLKSLHVSATSTALDLTYSVRGGQQRAEGEVVQGDALIFRAQAAIPGFLYLFSVDCDGVIHPLHPQPGDQPSRVQAGESTEIGSEGSFTVQEPYGQEMVCAMLPVQNSQALTGHWMKNDIGATESPQVVDQEQFLRSLSQAFGNRGKRQRDFAWKTLFIRSFRK